jgi:D-alanyl-D-alanine dipeptidase
VPTQSRIEADGAATVLLADPRISAVPVHDNGERLVDLRAYGISCTDKSTGPQASRMVRSGLADRLRTADRSLPHGTRLHVVEGFRARASQQAIIASYSASLRRTSPDLTDDDVARLSSRFVAPLDIAPHVAGAAVDVTVVGRRGQALDLGTEVDATPELSDGACYFDARNISAEARVNRSVLAAALRSAGLVNYPTEWWHWSYGDPYWAHVTGAHHAVYGAVSWPTPPGAPIRAGRRARR